MNVVKNVTLMLSRREIESLCTTTVLNLTLSI
jgi:hypothetical protein